MKRLAVSALAALAVVLAATASLAGDTTQQAREAFDRGNEAHERHDYAKAAREFARADELAPNDDALGAALDEVALTDDAVFAMRLVQRAEGRAGAASSAAKARAKFANAVGYLKVSCECTVDGESAPRARVLVVAPGTHQVAGTRAAPSGPQAWSEAVTVGAGATIDVDAPAVAPPVEHRPEPQASHGLSPWWVFAGSVVSVGLGAGTLVSFFDAKSQHDTFVAQQCQVVYAASCDGLASNGRAADVRTGVLLGVTLGVAAATVILAAVGVRWSSRPRAVAVMPGSVRIVW